jgi:hypothetical protein
MTLNRWGDDGDNTRGRGGPANPGYNPWNDATHRRGYLPNVEDYAEWEWQHRHDDGTEDGDEVVQVKKHRKKSKR